MIALLDWHLVAYTFHVYVVCGNQGAQSLILMCCTIIIRSQLWYGGTRVSSPLCYLL
eukprot:SAG11_NODE_19478_length_465_cov_3.243169_1_plen_56_part_10